MQLLKQTFAVPASAALLTLGSGCKPEPTIAKAILPSKTPYEQAQALLIRILPTTAIRYFYKNAAFRYERQHFFIKNPFFTIHIKNKPYLCKTIFKHLTFSTPKRCNY